MLSSGAGVPPAFKGANTSIFGGRDTIVISWIKVSHQRLRRLDQNLAV
jgi:hypothetical protein